MSAGSIQIDILANTQKLVSGMSRAEKTVGRAAKNMTRMIGAFATIFVAGKLTSSIARSNAELDKLAKTSSKLGIGAEKLQVFHMAAEEAGVATKTFDMAMQRMVRRVAEAAQGTGEASTALKELGINAKDLAALSPDEQMSRLADAMSQVTNQGDRVRLSMKLFDSEGVALVNMLQKGSKGFDEVATKMERFGLIVGAQYLPAIEKSNDAWAMAEKVMGSVSTGVGVVLADVFSDLTTELMNSGANLNIFKDTLDIAKKSIYNIGMVMNKIISSVKTSMKGLEGTVLLFKDIFAFVTDDKEAHANFIKWTKEARVVTDDWAKSMMGLDGSSKFLDKWMNKDMSKQPLGVSGGAGVESEQKKTITLWNQMGLAADEYYNKVSNKTTQATTIIGTMNSTISNGITGAFRQAMDGATSFGETFKNILKDIVAQLIHTLVVQQAVAAALKGMGFAAAPTGSYGAGSYGPVRADGMLADGGITKRGGSFLVGERGPEIVTLPGNTNVTPNDAIGGGGSNITINNYGNDNVSASQDEAGNIEIVIAALSSQVTRGTGPFGTAIESRYGLSKN